MMRNNDLCTSGQNHTRPIHESTQDLRLANYHSFTPRVVDSLVEKEGRDNIPKILGDARYHSFTLKVSSHKKGRNNIAKILNYAKYDSITSRVGWNKR